MRLLFHRYGLLIGDVDLNDYRATKGMTILFVIYTAIAYVDQKLALVALSHVSVRSLLVALSLVTVRSLSRSF